jgi:hypothetical protein
MNTTTTWLTAPTGFPAQGGVDARTAMAGGVAVRIRNGVCRDAAVVRAQGSGLSASGASGDLQARTAGLIGVPVFGDATGLTTVDHTTYIQNKGTTFGSLSSRRPSS